MITRVKIENFKSHLDTIVNLSNLTILAGVNGMGKSSFIQSLLLLRQSFFKNQLLGIELLNGDLCKVGSIQDAIALSAEENTIRFGIADNGYQPELNLEFKFTDSELSKTFIPCYSTIGEIPLSRLSLFNSNFQYLSAYRNGPNDEFPADTYQVEHLEQISVKEGRGEMTAHYIDFFGNKSIAIEALRHPNAHDDLLKTQIGLWLREFSRNINLHISQSTETSYKVEYSFDREKNFPTTRFKSKNVGFGITYDLPLLTAILSAKPNDLIIIENPEAHIHPTAQATLMELICKAAEAGVQFIIETHSDHIINGALVATKKEIIRPDSISMYYFDRDETKHFTKPIYLPVLSGGKISRPPKGFFDQIDIDLETLMGF